MEEKFKKILRVEYNATTKILHGMYIEPQTGIAKNFVWKGIKRLLTESMLDIGLEIFYHSATSNVITIGVAKSSISKIVSIKRHGDTAVFSA